MCKRRRTLAALLWCILTGTLALGGGGAPISLDNLIAASDVVVIGRIVEGAASGVTFNLSIEVERAIKGNTAKGATLAVTGTTSEPSRTRSILPGRGIFFVSMRQAGIPRLVPPVSGYLPDERASFIPLPSVASTVQPAGTPKEQVMLEKLGALESGEQVQQGGMLDLLAEYHFDPTGSVRSVFRRWMRGNSPRLVAMGLRALVAEGDIEALTRIATDESLKSNPAINFVLQDVKRFRNADAAAVTLLGRLATTASTTPELRAASATALGWMHTQQALPYLAQLLEEQNITLITAAVGGLSSFANNVPIDRHEPAPGEWKYRTEETIAHSAFDENIISKRKAYYVDFWRAWWSQHEPALKR